MLFIVTIVWPQHGRSASGLPLHLPVTGTSAQVRMCELCVDKGRSGRQLLLTEQNGLVTSKRLAPRLAADARRGRAGYHAKLDGM